MRISIRIAAVMIASIMMLSSANAVPIVIDPSGEGSSVDITINNAMCSSLSPCTIEADISDSLEDASTLLDVGASWTFDFFEIVVGGLGVVTDATVSAVLAYNEPDALSVATGYGGFFTFWGRFSGGSLFWNQPDYIALADGSTLIVEFEDLVEIGFGNSTTVSATVRRVAKVPEPITLTLFGIGLLGMALVHRRRRVIG